MLYLNKSLYKLGMSLHTGVILMGMSLNVNHIFNADKLTKDELLIIKHGKLMRFIR